MTEKIEKIQTGIQNSGVEDVAAIVVEEQSSWIKSKRYLYFASMILPGVPILSAYIASETGNGLWLWSLFVVFYAFLPMLDQLSGTDAANPSDELVEELKDDRYYVHILYGATIAHWVALIYMAYTVSTLDISWFSILGVDLSIGLAKGLALVAGPEMVHKVIDKVHDLFANVILACSDNVIFFI